MGDNGYAIGVDLGTTFTAAAVGTSTQTRICQLGASSAAIPSVVLLRADGTVLVGEAAARRAIGEPTRAAREFKRRLGDSASLVLGGTPYSADTLLGHVLRAVLHHVVTEEGREPDIVCLTHPANWGTYKLDLLMEACRVAGVDRPLFLAEPQAAAIHYATDHELEPGDHLAVYDLGGGTFDAAVLRRDAQGFELVGAPEGIERFGGIDLDHTVFSHVTATVGDALDQLDPDDRTTIEALANLREACQRAKEALSADSDTTIPVLLPNLHTQVRMTRTEFEDLIRPRLRDTLAVQERVVASAGIRFDDLARTLLVGGSSRIPLVAELVTQTTGRPVALDASPKHAIALGAATIAARGLIAPTVPVTDDGSLKVPSDQPPPAERRLPRVPVPRLVAGAGALALLLVAVLVVGLLRSLAGTAGVEAAAPDASGTSEGTSASTATPTLSPTATPTPVPEDGTLTVTSTGDSGPGTLRQLLLDAQEGDTIVFDPEVFPLNVPVTIAVESALPQIVQDSLTIDASDAEVILDGSLLPRDSWEPGLEILSDNNTVRGLMVINFTGTGIVVAGGRNNTIGGDRSIGLGPTGQGNLTQGNDFGIGVWDRATDNVVTGNLIGTDAAGTPDLGNASSGIWVEGIASQNVIGPDNVVASSRRCGIDVETIGSLGNTITANNVWNSDEGGICLRIENNSGPEAPLVTELDLSAGLVRGTACAGCVVEVFSDEGDEGAWFEGELIADGSGAFVLDKGSGFAYSNVTVTATDADGNTSEFSLPARGSS